jgi:Holliday junction resolvase RusA-like endonuclease
MQITLKGRVPSKKNSRITIARRGRVFNFPSNQYQAWHKEQVKIVNALKLSTFTFCSIIITFFFPDNRTADLINKAESILDLLVDCHIIKDDDWTCVNSLHLVSGGKDKKSPRAEIEIIDLSADIIS